MFTFLFTTSVFISKIYISGTLIFVVRGDNSQSVQVVDVVSGDNYCSSDLPDYPLNPWAAAGALFENTPVVCGHKSYTKACYSYDKASNTWQLFGNLVTGRRHHCAVIFREALWVTGGYNGNRLRSTEIMALDGTVTSGPNLPADRYGHCMVVLNNDEFMILGSDSSGSLYRNTMTYNANSGTFTNGPSMLHDRRDGACSIFYSKLHNDRPVLLVAGGYGDNGTPELLDYSQENAQWEEGMNFTDNSRSRFIKYITKEKHHCVLTSVTKKHKVNYKEQF